MTPVAKAWSTDQGFEIASTGVQVHGGMGYIEETGAAQYLRDARITMIYEGTNGIQALDLVRRKLPREIAATNRLFDQMQETIQKMLSSDDMSLTATANQLETAFYALQKATEWIRTTVSRNPEEPPLGQHNIVKCLACCRRLATRERALQANSNLENRGFSDRKKITASFSLNSILPQQLRIGPYYLSRGYNPFP
ncbi:MAG: hypothetical protein CM1200mP4_5120 [Rhodospirillaceae bacterium]|nr:MAG: hypothetical protein CM1200mP4_5120 [Rhodospirillaceae bacterium]